MKYVAIDFETGNHHQISACAIGLSYYNAEEYLGTDTFLIRPPDVIGKFHWYNVKIHGIEQKQVEHAPTFDLIWKKICNKVEGRLIVCHNASFDIQVLYKCLEYYQIPKPDCSYICTVKVAKEVWPSLENHKLNTVAQALNITLEHHDAGSDAHASGEILQRALQETGCRDAWELSKKYNIPLGKIDSHIQGGR